MLKITNKRSHKFPLPSKKRVTNLMIIVDLYRNESEMNLKIENKPQIYRLTNTNLDSRHGKLCTLPVTQTESVKCATAVEDN